MHTATSNHSFVAGLMSLAVPGLGYTLTDKNAVGFGWLISTLTMYMLWWYFRDYEIGVVLLVAGVTMHLVSVVRSVRAVAKDYEERHQHHHPTTVQ